MAKAVLISIHPEWVDKILTGTKALEARRTRPNLGTPFKCYVYCTKGRKPWALDGFPGIRQDGNVVAEFTCDRIDCADIPYPAYMGELARHWTDDSCCTYWQLHRYFYHDNAYFWHISNLKIYGKPLDLAAFQKYGDNAIKRPPQSWCYVEEKEGVDG